MCGTDISSQTWKLGLKLSWKVICYQWPKNWKVVGPNFSWFQNTKTDGSVMGYFRFWFWSFNLWLRPTSCPKMPKNCFSFKGERSRCLTLTYLDCMAEFFLSFLWKWGSKLDQKSKLWVCPVSLKIQIFERLFKQCFYLLKYYDI